MSPSNRYTATIALFVALGGFLMGFDASVISGVVGFIEVEFSLPNHLMAIGASRAFVPGMMAKSLWSIAMLEVVDVASLKSRRPSR